jgi:RNA polymerase sigma-70 factor, ECF subfamily
MNKRSDLSQSSMIHLVQRAQGRDPRAFEALVRSYERPLLAFLLGLTANTTEAEELAQESFVRAYFDLAKLKNSQRFGSWLFGMARNVYRESVRDRAKRRGSVPAPTTERTEILKRKAVFHAEIYQIVQALPDPYCEVLLLRYFGENPVKDIARLVGSPVGTVTKQLSRAHAMVADKLQRLSGFTTLLRYFVPGKSYES